MYEVFLHDVAHNITNKIEGSDSYPCTSVNFRLIERVCILGGAV